MAGAIGASIAVTLWDDHAIVSRSELVSKLQPQEVQNTLTQNGFSTETALGTISNLVDKESITLATDHVFLVFSLVFLVAGLIIWLSPKPKHMMEGPPPH